MTLTLLPHRVDVCESCEQRSATQTVSFGNRYVEGRVGPVRIRVTLLGRIRFRVCGDCLPTTPTAGTEVAA